jgi:hypothetical protein
MPSRAGSIAERGSGGWWDGETHFSKFLLKRKTPLNPSHICPGHNFLKKHAYSSVVGQMGQIILLGDQI